MCDVKGSEGKFSRWWQHIFQLRPNSWKSDSHLNQKQVNRCKTNFNDPNCRKENIIKTQPLSKSTDWTDVNLEVPENDEAVHLRNPKLSLIFDNETNTPTPPPRKHKKGFREKIEAVAKSGLQAFQSKKPVEEPLCVKKIVNQTCPLDDHDCAIHNRNHKHDKPNETNERKDVKDSEDEAKQAKRKKNLSVVSLPNYSDLKLSVANFDDIDGTPDQADNNSLASLQNESKKLTSAASTGKLETCMTRCRSFGSLLPQQLLDRLRVKKIPIDNIESDDSFGALEDWDLRIIEHYNPTDTSLPRQTKPPKSKKDVLSDIESLIVTDDDVETPKAPARRSESLLKKINREASESARRPNQNCERAISVTPPPTPDPKEEYETPLINAHKLPTEENGQVEHSSLMKILEEFSMRDKQKSLRPDEKPMEEVKINKNLVNNVPVILPPRVELQKKIDSVEDFLNNEKLYINDDMQHTKLGNMEMVKT